MKSPNTIILVGGIHLNHKPTCGETMKNQLFIQRFNELFDKVIPVDTFEWRRRPWCLTQLFFTILFHPSAKVIISASSAARYLIHFLHRFPFNKHVYFWAVGGNLSDAIKKGRYDIRELNSLVYIPVQGKSMVKELEEIGVRNSIYVPNSKPITFSPTIIQHPEDQPYRFVFLSRIHPDKGINEIVEASMMLDSNGFKGRYIIDFYGKIEENYAPIFDYIISQNQAICYKGYLDLTNNHGYELLSSYDVMLFPTYWDGEGFPGVVLDANMSGLPIIASDWNLNTEVIENGKTGIIIPTHDSKALCDAMLNIITQKIDLLAMKNRCVEQVLQYDFRAVLSEELMKALKLF